MILGDILCKKEQKMTCFQQRWKVQETFKTICLDVNFFFVSLCLGVLIPDKYVLESSFFCVVNIHVQP